MTINGEVQLAAPREVVWTNLNDRIAQGLHPRMRGAGENRGSVSGGRQDEVGRCRPLQGPGHAERISTRRWLQEYRAKARACRGMRQGGWTVALPKSTTAPADLRRRGADRRQLAQLGQRFVTVRARKLADEFFSNSPRRSRLIPERPALREVQQVISATSSVRCALPDGPY